MADTANDNSDTSFRHHDAELKYVDPSKVKVDEFNERQTGVGPETDLGDLEQSIKENGIEDPPQARPKDDGEGYKVFAGQRRLMAAKAVGVPEIPLIVKELDDMEALAASVNENNEYLDKDVSRKDRAKALEELVEDWGIEEVADQLGIDTQTVRLRLEPTNDFWSGTIFDPDVDSDIDTEYLADDIVPKLRRVTGDSELAERFAKKIIEKNVPPGAVRSAAEVADGPEGFWDEIVEQWNAKVRGEDRIRPRITLTGDDVEQLHAWAKDRGLNEKKAVKQIVLERLQREQTGNVDLSELDDEIANDLRDLCDKHDMDMSEAVERALDEWLYYLTEHGIDRLSVFDDG